MKLVTMFLLILTIIFPISSFPCGHSQLQKNITLKFINYTDTETESKLRNTAEYHPLEFFVDYTNFVAFNPSVSQSYQKQMKNAITKATEALGKLLNVAYHPRFSAYLKDCDSDLIYNEFVSTSKDVLLIPLIKTQRDLGENVIASASACLMESRTKRPIAGILNLLNTYKFESKNAEEYLQMLLIHEITHILVFSSGLFDYFNTNKEIYKQVTLRGEKKIIIVTPKVVEMARVHFGCDSLEGVEIESQGGSGSAGSHWEARTMLGDYMISTNYDESVISEITLALFEDSGWYTVNYYTGGLFRFGKNQGCDFIKEKCVIDGKTTFPLDFCTKNYEGCTAGHLAKGECYLGKYEETLPKRFQYFSEPKAGGFPSADYCPVTAVPFDEVYSYYLPLHCKSGTVTHSSKYGETLGERSICVETIFDSKHMGICYEVKCKSDPNRIEITVNDEVIVCKEGEEEKEVLLHGVLYCPDYIRICSGTKWCNDPLDCINDESYNTEYKKGNYIHINILLLMLYLFILGIM